MAEKRPALPKSLGFGVRVPSVCIQQWGGVQVVWRRNEAAACSTRRLAATREDWLLKSGKYTTQVCLSEGSCLG